jgi:hypothetical protein
MSIEVVGRWPICSRFLDQIGHLLTRTPARHDVGFARFHARGTDNG